MKTIELTAIDLEVESNLQYASEQAAHERANPEETQEMLDDLENPVAPGSQPAPVVRPEPVLYYPMTINPAGVREFYARKKGRAGTRVVMLNGAALIVKETYSEVAAKFASLNN